MEQNLQKDSQKAPRKKKSLGNNVMLFLILSSWLLFYVFIGSQGGG